MSTNEGLTRFDASRRKFRNFNAYNGLKSSEFNFGSGAKLRSGELVFGSINGFNIVHPNQIPINKNKPKVIISDFGMVNKQI